MPERHLAAIRDAARTASYGWDCVPVEASVDAAQYTTSLFPKDGGYLLPVKAAVRRGAGVELGDRVAVTVRVRAASYPVPNGSTLS